MTQQSKTIVFFGTDSFSVSALKHLIESGYSIAAVVTKPDSRSGRGQKLTAPAVKTLAEAHDIPVWQPSKLDEIMDSLRQLQPVTGVLSSFGRIIPQSMIDLFTPGIINVHPSMLPLYRGPSPIETAIANGDTITGVSIMKLSAAMDAGPVYAQLPYSLTGNEDQAGLYDTLAELGSRLLMKHLPAIMDGSLEATEQAGTPTYTALLKKSEALRDPSLLTAQEIERAIRAYSVFPKTKLTLMSQVVSVTAAHVVATSEGPGLIVACKDATYLSIDTLIGPSGRRMSGVDFKNGYAAGA